MLLRRFLILNTAPKYNHNFSLSAPTPPETVVTTNKNKNNKRTKQNSNNNNNNNKEPNQEQNQDTNESSLKELELLEHKKLLLIEIEQAFQPFSVSKIIPQIRSFSVAKDNILNNLLPISKYVQGWSEAAVCTEFRLASVLPYETKIINRTTERTKRIDVPIKNSSSTESVRVNVSLLQRNALQMIPFVSVYLSWSDVYHLLLSFTGAYECTHWQKGKVLWMGLLARDVPWASNLLKKADLFRRRQLSNNIVKEITKKKIKEAVDRASKKARAWARANAHLTTTKSTTKSTTETTTLKNVQKNVSSKKSKKKILPCADLEIEITSSAGFESWKSLTIRTKHIIETRKELIDPHDNGAVLDMLHSSKHLYLCIAWCMRASHQKLMMTKYITSIEALRQPPIALNVLMEHFTIKEKGK